MGAPEFRLMMDQFDQALRGGHVQSVAQAMSELNLERLPREWRLPLAEICRRAGLVSFGLRLLAPVVRGELPSTASAAELTEYASLLQRSGLIAEALSILTRVDSHLAPEADLIAAICHARVWDYARSAQHINTYLGHDLNPEKRLAGQVHLAQALVRTGRFKAAGEHLRELSAACSQQEHVRTLVQVLEVSTELAFYSGDLGEARLLLDEAAHWLKRTPGPSPFHAVKWNAVIDAFTSKNAEPLRTFRADAFRRGDGDGARDADLFLNKLHYKADSYDHLHFGTPYAAYRVFASAYTGRSPSGPEFLLGDKSAPCFDLRAGQIAGYADLSPGSKVHRLFQLLFSDLYKPFSTGALFAHLFGPEPYDVRTSPERVQQELRRARRFLEASRVPLIIAGQSGDFRIKITGPLSVLLRIESVPPVAKKSA